MELKTNFEFEKYGIGVEDIKTEAEQLLKQSNEIQERKTNRFPVEVFPLPVQQVITATNENLNFPIDFIGASLLYAVSVAVGNTHSVEVKKGFQQSAVLYLAIVARAGTTKSHPLSFALQPIVEQDKKTYRQYEQQRQEYEKAVSLSKKEREQQAIDEPIKPIWQKFLLSDFTPEALAEVHKFNKRGIGVYVDELAGWFKNFNRYNKGSEMEFWLSQWSGKPINIDRKTGEPVFIPLPFISVAGTIQKGILNELAKDSRTQNGFIDRILFVIPDNIQKGRTVTLFPDLNGFEKWSSKAKELSNIASFQVSDLLERKAPEAERKQGFDLADYLIKFNYKEFALPEAEQTEKARREKQSVNAVNRYTKDYSLGQLIDASYKDNSKRASHKIADTFNTNRTYISEAAKLKAFNPEVFEQVKSWEQDIAELENYYEGIELPTQPVKLNQCSTITNCSLFIESHFSTVKSNNGNKYYLPYLNRLQELKQVLTTNLN